MKEVLFRGKTVDENKWIQGSLVRALGYLDEDEKFFIIPEDALYYNHGEFDFVKEVRRETVGQYTGLKDKNGQRVFEGDIVKVKHTLQNCSKEDLPKTPRRGYGAKVVDGVWCAFNLEYFRNYKIIFKPDRQQLMIRNKQDYHYLCDTFVRYHEVAVIGNIHDNPNLLDEVKE